MRNRRLDDAKADRLLWVVIAVVLLILIAATIDLANAQEVVFCKHAQTGEVIAIEKGYACPMGFYRI